MSTVANMRCQSAKKAGFSSTSNPNQTVMGCGKAAPVCAYNPCDVDYLKLESIGDKLHTATVKCDKRASDDTSLNSEQQRLLGGDDILLQTVADFHHDGSYDTEKMKKATIALYGSTSPSCIENKHRLMEWTPVTNADEGESKKEWPDGKAAEDQELLAQSTRFTAGGFLERFWPFNVSGTKIYRATISSCGVRDGELPTVSLRGRIEVQPDVKYQLSLKIPSFRKYTRERKGQYDLLKGKRTKSNSTSTSWNFGREEASNTSAFEWNKSKGFSFETKTSSLRTDGGNTKTISTSEGRKNNTEYVSETETEQTHGLFMDTALTYTDTTEEAPKLTEELQAGQNISLKCNERELDIVKSIEKILQTAHDIQKAWDNFEKAVPKIGWQASLEIEIFTGTVTGEWGIRPKPAATHARIWETEQYFSFIFQTKIFYLKASLGFGFEFIVENWFSSHPLLEIIVKVEGGITVEVAFNGTVTSSKKDTLHTALNAKPVAFLNGIARASALGYAFEASCKIEAGIEFSGSFECDFDFSPTCKGKLEWVPITVTTTLEYPGKKPRQHVWSWPEKKLKPIWEDVMFGDPGTH